MDRSLLVIPLLFLVPQAVTTSPQVDGAAQNQQQARVLIDQMINALGGKAYFAIEDVESEGRSGVFNHERSQGSTVYQRLWKWPDKEWLELGKQRDVVQLTVGDSMYEITFRGTRMIDPEKSHDAKVYLARRHHALEIVLRRWLDQPGTALFYEGPALTENHAVERVTIMTSGSDAVTFAIDRETHLPVKKIFILRNPATRDRDEIVEIYDNWKRVQEINTPFNTLVTVNGELSWQYFLNTVSYNNHLADSVFSPARPLPFAKPSPR
ncbi:MAG TPA: hypothetical protein VKW06_04890 [Candidatus Angelobacter sp.]|nr:hypothetical protein [Candidatus Angelobacter sp.]